MKFIHIADIHFDTPFTILETRGLSEVRRIEQRNAFKKVIDYIKEKSIEYLFICGDVYEQESVRKSTIEYINKRFEEIPNTKVFIVPGNHDPFIKNSYYNTFNFAPNVKIFKSNIEKVEEQNVDIYGYGFEDFYMKVPENTEFNMQSKNKINILLTHCDLDGGENGNVVYNPILRSKMKSFGFDYVGIRTYT